MDLSTKKFFLGEGTFHGGGAGFPGYFFATESKEQH
jgi:hypothetical protein